MADTAIGKGVDAGSALGYISTDSTGKVVVDAGSLAVTAASRSAAVWRSYADDRDGGLYTTTSTRTREAAYYYGLESFAEELIRLRIGNIGAAKESHVAEAVLQKAMALMASAQAGIKAYEEFCANEAKVTGAKVFNLIADATQAAVTGVDAAEAHWGMIAVDPDSPTFQGDNSFLTGMGHAYAMQIVGAIVAQNQLGFSGARNPAIGQYYLGAAQSLIQAGTNLVQKFGAWAAVAKPQHTIMQNGI